MSEPREEPTVTLYQYPRAGRLESLSPFCVKVHLALMLKGVPYRAIDRLTPGQVRSVNKRGRLPAANLSGDIVVDSTEICETLDRQHPDPPLWPEDPALRARARILEDWADEVLYFYVIAWRWLLEPPNTSKVFKTLPKLVRPLVATLVRREVMKRLRAQGTGLKPIPRIEQETRDALDAVAELASASPTGFLLGTEQPTIADLAVFSQVDGLYWKPLPRASALVEGNERLMAWYRAVDAATRGKKKAAQEAAAATAGA